MKPSRTQRRLPFTSWPMPGTSTSTSSAMPTPSSTMEYFSQAAVGTASATAPATMPSPTNMSCRRK
jgi:hypothetical protein